MSMARVNGPGERAGRAARWVSWREAAGVTHGSSLSDAGTPVPTAGPTARLPAARGQHRGRACPTARACRTPREASGGATRRVRGRAWPARCATGPDAQPRHRADAPGDAEQLAQERLPVERHPPHPPALGRAGQPQVLDGQADRVEPGVGDGVAAEDVGRPPGRVVGDHHRQAGLEDAVDLDPGEALGALADQGIGEHLRRSLLDVVPERPSSGFVGDEDEVPRLAEARRSGRCGRPSAPGRGRRLGDGLAGELGADVAPAVDDVVEPGVGHPDRSRRARHARRWGGATGSTGSTVPKSCRRAGATVPISGSLAPSDGPALAGDACSLVDAFRAGELTPPEALELSLAAIERSALNAFCHVDADRGTVARRRAPTSRSPSGACPSGSRSSTRSRAGPAPRRRSSSPIARRTTRAPRCERLVRQGRRARRPDHGERVRRRQLHDTTAARHHPQSRGTPSAPRAARQEGSAAAVAGGLVPIASGGDGGGSHPDPGRFHGDVRAQVDLRAHPEGPVGAPDPPHRHASAASAGRCATRRAGSTCATATTPTTPSAFRGSRDGRPASALIARSCAGKRAVIAVDLGVAVVNPAVHDPRDGRRRSAHRRRRAASASTSRSAFRPPSSNGPCPTS